MINLLLDLDDNLLAKLQRRADIVGVGVADVIRDALSVAAGTCRRPSIVDAIVLGSDDKTTYLDLRR